MTRPHIDYTARDWAALGAMLEAQIRARFPEWTDFNASNAGNMLKELVQAAGDQLHYYLDRQANECFADTAEDLENLLSLCQWLGYRPRGYRAARAGLSVALAANCISDVVFPRGTQVFTDDPIKPLLFEFETDCVIPAGGASGRVTARHAQTRHASVYVGGQLSQAHAMEHAPYVDDSMRATLDGMEWTRVDDFLSSGSDSAHYVVSVDADYRATVHFGDGMNGRAPSGLLAFSYQTGGGAKGNVPAGSIAAITGVFTDLGGRPVSVSVTNPAAASGGEDPESVEQIRRNAPRSIRASTRTVTREDFETNAELVDGVARALAHTVNEDASLEENMTRVYIVPDGGGAPAPALKEAVTAVYATVKPVMLTHEFDVVDAQYVAVDVAATVSAKPGYDAEEVRRAVEAAVLTYFDYSARDPEGAYILDFGKKLYVSEIIALIQGASGVKGLQLASPSSDVACGAHKIPALGALTISVI